MSAGDFEHQTFRCVKLVVIFVYLIKKIIPGAYNLSARFVFVPSLSLSSCSSG
jgi:hypothetical protein